MKKIKRYWLLILLIVVLGILLACGYLYVKKHPRTKLKQAIFLTSGQVYFGYSEDIDDQIIRVSNVYYIKTQDLLQQNTDQNGEKKKISLVKLGNELHGPTDEIFINRDQILFIENMRSDSKISQAIDKNIQPDN